MGEAYRFLNFRLDGRRRILLRDGELLTLPPKVVETLLVLVRRSGEVVDKDTIFREVWPGTHVVESSLTRNISLLRKALDHDEESPLIQTVSKRGYRFIPVVVIEKTPDILSRRRWMAAAGAAGLAAGMGAWFLNRPRENENGLSEEYRQYLIGRHLWSRFSTEDLEKALAHFQRAVRENPRLALGYAGIADTYVAMASLGVRPVETSFAEARRAAERAVELDPNLALARTSLGLSRLMVDWDWQAAERELRRAVSLDPRSARSHYGVALLRLYQGRFAEARSAIDAALSIDPVSSHLALMQGRIEYYRRDYDACLRVLGELLDRESRFSLAHYFRALALGFQNQLPSALAALEASRVSESLKRTDRAWLLARSGELKEARLLWTERKKAVDAGQMPLSALLLPSIMVDESEIALAAVDDVVARKHPEALGLGIDPRLDPLHSQPRFQAALRKVGFRQKEPELPRRAATW